MANDFMLVVRMLAFEAGRALPIASRRRVAVKPDAWVLSPLVMAGEDSAVHAVACGRIGEPAVIRIIPDPRRRDDLFELFEWLGELLTPYIDDCLRDGTYPQLWVPSGAALELLNVVGQRLWNADCGPYAKRLGEMLVYAAGRESIAGQQAMHAASKALASHFAAGQQAGEDEHLGAMLAWVDPPLGMAIMQAVYEAESLPMGVKTDPKGDGELKKNIEEYNEARRDGRGRAKLAHLAAPIERSLEREVLRRYDATQRAIRLLLERFPAPLNSLPELEQLEADDFRDYMTKGKAYVRPGRRDNPGRAAATFTERELAHDNYLRLLVHEDALARAQARATGDVLQGEVLEVRQMKVPRTFEWRWLIASRQPMLHLRRGDELCLLDDSRLVVVVERLHRRADQTEVLVKAKAGHTIASLPEKGATIELGPLKPDLKQWCRERKAFWGRINARPWTHASSSPPPPRPSSESGPPADLLNALQQLR